MRRPGSNARNWPPSSVSYEERAARATALISRVKATVGGCEPGKLIEGPAVAAPDPVLAAEHEESVRLAAAERAEAEREAEDRRVQDRLRQSGRDYLPWRG